MVYPPLPTIADTAQHFIGALKFSRREDNPYRHWKLREALPEKICTGVLVLPIAPPMIEECAGVRDFLDNNKKRSFFTPQLRADFPAAEVFASALQLPEVARQLSETLGNDELEGSYLRMEYIQDTNGAWLKPHCDIYEKLFSMVIYLCTGPEAKNWGTDIYDANQKWCGRAVAEFNSAVIFIPGNATWHGFDKRPIIGVRRLLEINYVRPNWRDREQLAFPEQPIWLA